MILTRKYLIEFETKEQEEELNIWLRICRYWYNKMIGERFAWYEENNIRHNSCLIDRCPLTCSISAKIDSPNYYSQKRQIAVLNKSPVAVQHSGEILDFAKPHSSVMQNVCKRVDLAFTRFLKGDSSGNRSGRPKFKGSKDYTTLFFENVKDNWLKEDISNKQKLIRIPKIGNVKINLHRPLPESFILKQIGITKELDGWYILLIIDDHTTTKIDDEILPTWDNSIGLDAVLKDDVYLATSEGEKLNSLKAFRKSQDKLAEISKEKAKKQKGSNRRKKAAIKEAKLHKHIARQRKDFQYKIAHALCRTGKKVFFVEDLNLKGLTKRNKAKQDKDGTYLPNGQSSKSGLNKSWQDAAFGQFVEILTWVAQKYDAKVVKVNPAYTSQLLSYRDELVFTDCSIREYFDKELELFIDRDINAGINIKRVGLEIFPVVSKKKEVVRITKSSTESSATAAIEVFKNINKSDIFE